MSYKIRLCENCGHGLRSNHSYSYNHINIAQDPAIHEFCSRKCKVEWCYKIAEENQKKWKKEKMK